VAFLTLLIASLVVGFLGHRDAPKLSSEGKGTLFASFIGAATYNVITGQRLSDVAWFLVFAETTALVVTTGHPKRLLPNGFLDFAEDDPRREQHERREKLYGWVFGLIVMSVAIYVIFTSPTPYD
jgi:hypothetical protein